MNKYLIPLIITTGIGIYYFCNTKINNIKTLEIKNTESKKNKNIIKLETISELEIKENNIKQIKDKSKYQIVVYKKPEDWEIVN